VGPEAADSDPGDADAVVGGVRYRRGAHVRVVLGPEGDAAMQDRTGEIEAVHRNGEAGRIYLLVCLDAAPGEDDVTRIYVTPAEVDVLG
jgi:hypothetical protein